MDWKSILYMFLGAMLPVVYAAFIKNNPSFPLTQVDFVETILWIIGSIIGGWQAMKMKVNYYLLKKQGKSYAEWLRS
jgi:hypothetical protein